jgi:hypothetical protein
MGYVNISAWSTQRITMAVNFGFLERNSYFLQIAHQLSSRGWVDLVPDPLLLRKFDSDGNRTRDLWVYSQELWPLDRHLPTNGGRLVGIARLRTKTTEFVFVLFLLWVMSQKQRCDACAWIHMIWDKTFTSFLQFLITVVQSNDPA